MIFGASPFATAPFASLLDEEPAAWVAVDDSQSPDWAVVADSDTTWTPIGSIEPDWTDIPGGSGSWTPVNDNQNPGWN